MELLATIDRLVHREGYTLRGARAFWNRRAAKRRPPKCCWPICAG
jgi:hypothetical protein